MKYFLEREGDGRKSGGRLNVSHTREIDTIGAIRR